VPQIENAMDKSNNKYWRSLDQLHKSREYRKNILERRGDEFPDSGNSFSRRSFLSIMGASLALAGLAGCRRPVEKIVPYVVKPEDVIPGVAQSYATTMPLGTSAYGLIVESHEGRPTKIEGNPEHPSTLGSVNALIEASILDLYDPDRSKKVMHNGAESTYDDFVAFWRELKIKFAQNDGRGLAVLSGEFASPTLSRLKREFLDKYPAADWVGYEPTGGENNADAVKHLTGNELKPLYRYDQADVILSLDCDFLGAESENISAARGFSDRRKPKKAGDDMNRLYVVESAYSITGSAADHRLRLPCRNIYPFAMLLIEELAKHGKVSQSLGPHMRLCRDMEIDTRWITAIAEDLQTAAGSCLVVAGDRQPQHVHELAFYMNDILGNIGNTIEFVETKDTNRSKLSELSRLTDSMRAGNIDTLLILGGNPVYDTPADLNFADAVAKCNNSAHLGEYLDETSQATQWHIPRAHYLESWGDARASDGTPGVIQPMIEPLHNGHTDTEIFSLLATGRDRRGYDIVRETWREILKGGDFEKKWNRVLHDGYLKDAKNKIVKVRFNFDYMNLPEPQAVENKSIDKLEISFYPGKLHDGRFANNGWLQELPDPVTKLAWGNAALISPKTAAELSLKNNDIVNLQIDESEIRIPVRISPGQADYTVAVELGYGRKNIGRVADGVGVNVYTIQSADNRFFRRGAKLTATGEICEQADTQDHSSMHGRPIVREATFDEYKKHPEFAKEAVEHPPLKSIYPDHDYSKGYQWGMVIDLTACIGCGACTIACQSENNIPVVGKEQVSKGREMHWIRIDRYFADDENDPRMVHMPVACQHCENAPCESVCPVAATVHDKEGLNNMTYNRCIGTRYCSNNCPYKVRRFNFFNYTGKYEETIKMAQNPDVTVRARGVMEKCTFCTQRINRAKIRAKQEGREVRDGEFMTACEQACPTKAINFGNINDPDSKVSALKKIDRNYEMLAELNVRPRNSYLAKIRNPNPNLDNSGKKEE